VRRRVTLWQAVSCIVVCAVCLWIIAGMLGATAHSSDMSELVVAAVTFILGIGLCWGILHLTPKTDDFDNDQPEVQHGPWGNRTATDKPSSEIDVNARIMWTILVSFLAICAGFLWLMMSLWGSSEMLLSGWATIGVIALLVISLIWTIGVARD